MGSTPPPSGTPTPGTYETPEGPKDAEGVLIRDRTAKKSLPTYVWRAITHVLVSSMLGFIIDKILKYIQQRWKILPLILVAIQIVVGVSLMYAIERYIASKWADAWLNATPGTLFIVFFFGVQFNLFENFVAIGSGNGLVPPVVETPAQQKV